MNIISEEEHQQPKIEHIEEIEIIEQKPPNDKIIQYDIGEKGEKDCPNCNAKNLKKARFCAECGKRLN